MTRKVPDRPFMPKSTDQTPFMDILIRSLTQALSEITQRVNAMLPADGTERMIRPLPLAATTVATLATLFPPAEWAGAIVYVSDGASNKRLAISNGTIWRYPDGVAV